MKDAVIDAAAAVDGVVPIWTGKKDPLYKIKDKK